MCSSVSPSWRITRYKSEVTSGEGSVRIPPRHQLALTGAQRLCAKALCALSTPAKKNCLTKYRIQPTTAPSAFHLPQDVYRYLLSRRRCFHATLSETLSSSNSSNSDTAPFFSNGSTSPPLGQAVKVVAVRGCEVLALRLASASVVCPSRDVGEVGQLLGVPAWGRRPSGDCQVSHVVGSSVHQPVIAFSLADSGQTTWVFVVPPTSTQSPSTPSPTIF